MSTGKDLSGSVFSRGCCLYSSVMNKKKEEVVEMNKSNLRTSEQKIRFQQGLCAECGHDVFEQEISTTASALGSASRFIVCKKCDETYWSHDFSPCNLI